ncbi:helix-turn-helix domain-containing protein [Burkholderia cenocepacia]|uniref:helix-turn-helix domain-containing protein n=1 Tax=Burkholderia cenocepacia TaxID=95486 RepID=UPI0023B99BBA|nr:helix-turn-helix domain-containing protein [Burkholderia cenocepacia]MDF0504866.1 helix-turn-helix domain-containing protein [Burkholderia cenocepacia]
MSKPFKKKSGIEKVQQYLESGRSITALEALSNFGLFRLASAIEVLRKRGLNIVTDTKQDPNGKAYARYTLVKVVNEPPKAESEAAPKRELKVGDTVVVNDTYSPTGANVFKGRKGVVTNVRAGRVWPIAAQFEGHCGNDYFKASELDLVEPVKELKVGARVRVKAGVDDPFFQGGDEGTVVSKWASGEVIDVLFYKGYGASVCAHTKRWAIKATKVEVI